MLTFEQNYKKEYDLNKRTDDRIEKEFIIVKKLVVYLLVFCNFV